MYYPKESLYILGTARLGKTDPILSTHEIFFMGLIVDKNNNKIMDTTCNVVKEKTEAFINSMLVGYDIVLELDAMEHEIMSRYHGMAQRAILVAVKDARNKYLVLKKGQSGDAIVSSKT